MADEEDDDETEGSGGTSMVMLGGIGLVAFLLGGGAGFAGHMFGMPCQECDNPVIEMGEDGEPVVKLDHRVVHSLNPITVNLRGTGGGRMLRMEVQVEVTGEDLDAIKEQTPILRDAVLTLASDYTFPDLEGIDGKTRFRDELLSRLNGSLSEPTIKRIYFTKFVVQ